MTSLFNNSKMKGHSVSAKQLDQGSKYPSTLHEKSRRENQKNLSHPKTRKRTYTPWNNTQCGKGQFPVPALPLLQSSEFSDAQHSEFSLSGACADSGLFYDSSTCQSSDGDLESIPWVNVSGILKDNNGTYPPKSAGIASAKFQVLETIPNYIVESGSTDPVPGVPTYNMYIKGTTNLGPNPEHPFQTHASFVKHFDECTDSFNMCCMYFTFLSYTCPMCNKFMCNTDQLDPKDLSRLSFDTPDTDIVGCKRCMGTEHNVGCCDKGMDVNPLDFELDNRGVPIPNPNNPIDPLVNGATDSKGMPLKMADGTVLKRDQNKPETLLQMQNPDPATCRMGYVPKGAILGFENSDFRCNVKQAREGCKNLNANERGKCANDNDCLYGPCNKGICDVRPPLNIGQDPLDDVGSVLSDGSMLGTYKLAGVGVYNAMIRAARRGVKMKIVFGWPALANSYLTYVSLMKIKWAALDKSGAPAPNNIQLIPFNIAAFFQGEINNSNQSMMQIVKDCKTGEMKPIFTLQKLAAKKCTGTYDWENCPNNGKCYKGKCDISSRSASTNFYSGASGDGFAPGGYAAVGILHNKIYVWDNKSFYVGAQNATYDASKEMGIMISECPAMAQDANRVLNSYIHAACMQYNGKNSKQYDANATMNKKLGKRVLGSKITTDINMETPLPIKLIPVQRPDGLDGRPNFTSTVEASCYLTGCPKMFCDPANRTYDLEAVLCTINSAKTFCYLETYDYMEFTKFMPCQQSYCGPDPYTQYFPAQNITWNNEDGSQYNTLDPDTGLLYKSITTYDKTSREPSGIYQKTGPQVQFLLVRDALYEAALRGVTVRMIVGQRGVQPCGDNADKIVQLRALEVQANKTIQEIAKSKKIKNPGSIQFKYFTFLCSDTKRACYGAFHCKWIVTERTCAFSTSNYTGDYFAFTFGSTFVASVKNGLKDVFPMRDDLVNIFVRDWRSSKLVEDIACQCQIMGWPLKTLVVPDMMQHYFLSTPNGGLSSNPVHSIINKMNSRPGSRPGPQYGRSITTKDFCSKSCFQQVSGEDPLPESSCFPVNTAGAVLIENTPPIYPGENSEVVNGLLVEKMKHFTPPVKLTIHKASGKINWLYITLLVASIIIGLAVLRMLRKKK